MKGKTYFGYIFTPNMMMPNHFYSKQVITWNAARELVRLGVEPYGLGAKNQTLDALEYRTGIKINRCEAQDSRRITLGLYDQLILMESNLINKDNDFEELEQADIDAAKFTFYLFTCAGVNREPKFLQ